MTPKKKIDQLVKILRRASKNEKDLRNLLVDILSPGEIDDISARINISSELLNGKTQRQVSASQKVSIAKVTRVAQMVKYGSNVLKKLL
jgi:Trp operon repressor